MSENLYCDGNRITNDLHRDGWYRTFKGYPKMNKKVWKQLQKWKKKPIKLLLFFSEHVTGDIEYANFLTRDLMTGTWNG